MSHTKRKCRYGRQVIAVLALISYWFLRSALPALADQATRILDTSHQVRFSESVSFQLEVDAVVELEEVTLYYRLAGEGLTVRVPLALTPGQTEFSYTWELEPGEVPLGSRVEYEWRVVDVEGHELTTATASLEYDDDRFDWQALEEGQIIILWYGSSEEEARRLLGYATQSLARLQDETGVTLGQPVRIYAYRSKSDMSLALPRSSEAYDDRILTLGVVVDDATLLLLGPHSDVEGTIAHELSHIVVGLATDNPYASLPRWLDEGLAMYAEGALPSGNRRALERAVARDQLISVRSLSGYTGDPTQVDLFYGEVYSLAEYLLDTYGTDQMGKLLGAFREGITQEEALQRVYGFGVDQLDAQWRESLGLGPRGASPASSSAPRPEQRPCLPCPGVVVGGVIGVAAVSWGRKRARAS